MLVYDKNIFGSQREKDANGFLRVGSCNITRTQVAGYLGREIPNWKEFELEPDKIYYVLRPEEELKKAVDTFNNLPLTRKHIEVDVDNVPKEDIIGSLGDSAEFDSPFLKNSLIVYDKKYIDRIENGKQKELSCGYRYTPVRESGEFDGQHYDFVMTDIVGNHVALVKEGRAGHDVMVSDTIEAVKEKIMGLFGKKEIVNDEFKESEHPRAKNGQFTNAGGSGSEKKEESSEKDIIESLKNKFPRKSEKKDSTSEYKKERLKDVDAVSGKETEFYKAKEKEVDEEIKEAKEYVSAVIKKDTGEYKHGKDYFKHQAEKTKNRYGEESDYYKLAKLHLDLYNEMTNDSAEQEKIGVVMKEFKEGELKSGSGKKVTDPAQAKAIALSEAKKVKDEIPDGQDKPEKAGEEKADKEDKKVEEKEKESLSEDKCAKDEKIDKRKLIDEIGGILKGKVDDEIIRDIIGKAEKIAYEGSEAGEADDAEIKTKEQKEDFAEGVAFGEKKEKEEPKKLDSEHESEGMKKEEKKEMAKDEMTFDIDSIKAQVRQEVIEDFKAREDARKSVKPVLGEINVMAFDSCDEIYKMACEKAGLNVEEIASYKDAFRGFSAGKANKAGLALDATPKSSGNVEECFKDIRI